MKVQGNPRATDPVSALMEWPVVAVSPGDSLVQAAEVLAAGEVGLVPVLVGDGVVGVLSERDLVAHAALDTTLSSLTVGDAMATEVLRLGPGASIAAAGHLMRQAGVRHVPVVDDGELVGMVSMRDVLEVLLGPFG